jgi:predicted Zn-dependent peptidase
MSVRITRLANGLRVATDRMDTVETISVGVYVGVGTRHEPQQANGVAHLLEHMAFKGTTTRSARRIAEEIEAVGGQMNAHTGREQTAYHVKVLKGDLPLAVDLLADILQRSVYDPGELDRERTVILQELGQALDTPDDIVFDKFQETAYPGQALGRPVLGVAEVIESIPRSELIDYQNHRYGVANMVLAAAGNVDHDALVRMAGATFTDLSPTGDDRFAAARYVGGDFRDGRELEQLHFVLGFPGVAFADPDYYTAAVLSTLLGGGMSSRLFQEIRENRGLCYTISAFSSSFLDGGIFGIYTGTGEKESVELVPVLIDELHKATRPAPAEEVARSRAQMKAGLLMSLESTGARMDALGSQLLIFGRTIPTDEIAAKIDAVTAADVAKLASRIFSGNPTVAAMGPLGGLEPITRMTERLSIAPSLA